MRLGVAIPLHNFSCIKSWLTRITLILEVNEIIRPCWRPDGNMNSGCITIRPGLAGVVIIHRNGDPARVRCFNISNVSDTSIPLSDSANSRSLIDRYMVRICLICPVVGVIRPVECHPALHEPEGDVERAIVRSTCRAARCIARTAIETPCPAGRIGSCISRGTGITACWFTTNWRGI